MKAMIFAAGIGSRLQPITNSLPKPLVKFHGKPLLELLIRKLINHGFDEIIINVHHFADQIVEFLGENNNFGIRIEVSFEKAELLDTGGGLEKAAWFFDDDKPFLIHNCDILSTVNLKKMMEEHLNGDAAATLAVSGRGSSRVFLFDEGRLCGWKNHKTGEEKIARTCKSLVEKAFSGIQIIEPRLFELFPAEKVFSIIDFYLSIAGKEKIGFYEHSSSDWFDIGSIEKLRAAESSVSRDTLGSFVEAGE